MKKSVMSKKGSCVSFFTGSCKDEATLEIMRISLKKEIDRKDKLEKLLQKYDQIHGIQRSHVKSLKASIIELKDATPVPKIRFLVDPNIYVDNNLSIETREFLCLMLNTFYKRYDENATFEKQVTRLNEDIKIMLKTLSANEELLFKVQKTNINSQVQMEGELLSEKAKLKELNQKGKELVNEEKRVRAIWSNHKNEYDDQKQKVEELREIMLELEGKVVGLTQKISEGEQIRQGNQDKLSGEMAYQAKFEEEVNQLLQSVTRQINLETTLKKKIREKKLRVDRLKGQLNFDNSRHQANAKMLQLTEPRLSTKYNGISELIEIERTFEKAMTKTLSSTFPTFFDN